MHVVSALSRDYCFLLDVCPGFFYPEWMRRSIVQEHFPYVWANSFAIWDLTSSPIFSCSVVATASSSSSGAGLGSASPSSILWRLLFASILLQAFRIVSQALVDVASFPPYVGSSQWAGTLCSAADLRLHSRWECRDLSFEHERFDHTLSLVEMLCMIGGREKGVL